MDFLDKINEKTIIITPYNVKEKILDYIDKKNKLINIKMYTLDELKRYVLFDYDCNAILYLMDKYNYNYETAKNYIDNLYYIEEKKYKEEKLNFLVNLKQELKEKNLLIFNNLFQEFYKNTQFIVFGYDYLTSFDKKILEPFNYKVITKELVNKKIPVYEFATLEEEVLFVINKIVDLVNSNVDINRIYLLNLDSNYNTEILRLFKMFNLPIDINISSNILSTVVGKKAYEILMETKSFEKTLEFIENFEPDNQLNSLIYSKFLNIFNKYVGINYNIDTIIDAVVYELKNIEIDNSSLQNKIKLTNLNNSYFDSSDYVFLLGFNQGSIPKIYKDEDYIDESLKKIVGLDSVNVINKLEKNTTITNLKSIENLIVTYKLNYLDTEFHPSNLINDKVFELKEKVLLNTTSSEKYSNIKLACMLDELIKYDEKDKDLPMYFNSLNIRYMDYDNKYKKIPKELLYNKLNKKITLSYSTIDTYFKCGFRFYIDNILKLNEYEETFDTLIGSLFHYVLSHVYDDNFDLDKEYSYFLKDKTLTSKEQFYIDKLKKELKIVCNRLKDFYNDTGLTNVFTEKNIKIDKSKDIEVIFKGIVDKIMFKEYDNETLLAIIDYKTGHADIDIYNSVYGIGMQLLIYLYLITKSNLFDNFKCVGFYLQKILNNEVNIEEDKTYEELKNENLKLFGYSLDDPLSLERFDITYNDSKYIKSMKTTKNGFGAYSKVLSKEEMENLVNYVDKKIEEARDNILDSNFSINPKWINGDKEVTGCLYCKYQDICNRKNEDIVNLKKYNDLSFLKEGDINA